jgi:hypothetical protein
LTAALRFAAIRPVRSTSVCRSRKIAASDASLSGVSAERFTRNQRIEMLDAGIEIDEGTIKAISEDPLCDRACPPARQIPPA